MQGVMVDEGFLQWMQPILVGETLDRDNGRIIKSDRKLEAGVDASPVHENGTRTALPVVAALFVPVKLSRSLSRSSRVTQGSTESECRWPLTLSSVRSCLCWVLGAGCGPNPTVHRRDRSITTNSFAMVQFLTIRQGVDKRRSHSDAATKMNCERAATTKFANGAIPAI